MTNLHIYLRLVCFNALLYTGFTKKKADSGGKLTNQALVCFFNQDIVKIFLFDMKRCRKFGEKSF